MKELVISGINLFQGGTLSIYYDCLDALLEEHWQDTYHITAFVHRKSLFQKYQDKITLLELPKSRRSYLYRLYYEYWYFWRYSKRRTIDVWLSIHDMTPSVRAGKRYTYCHNATPFMKRDIRNIRYSLSVVLFSYLYHLIYKINMKKATAIIVQQQWMRKEFLEHYPAREVIVARPQGIPGYDLQQSLEDKPLTPEGGTEGCQPEKPCDEKMVFLFVGLPRFYKNIQVLLEACKCLPQELSYELLLTIQGDENSYARELKAKYKDLPRVRWLGAQTREEIQELYMQAHCLLFPSLLESWGLPISEFQATGKEIIAADLPYAHEAVGAYKRVQFFHPENASELAEKMLAAIKATPNRFHTNSLEPIKPPYADSWAELLRMLL